MKHFQYIILVQDSTESWYDGPFMEPIEALEAFAKYNDGQRQVDLFIAQGVRVDQELTDFADKLRHDANVALAVALAQMIDKKGV